MSEIDKQQVRRLFLAVADLPETEREAALARACEGEPALRMELESLLCADREAGAFLATPAVGASARPEPSPASAREGAGTQIDRYKLLEEIGEGGMGTIWMAEQREPVRRRVALKIIKLGMDTKQVIARFEAERQALAMMDHPHIAKVFDAGATETGRPYFVMEYIRGIPILEYCDQEKVDTKARLELFTSVCHAIQHAHQKGIIHRDIKPSNVLVTLHDGVPVPKVIDFGIAKATNSELTTKTLFTEHRQMVGTPAYMSPEQAEMSGLDIDTRSDIYSLGVLLYQLLTGTTPFDMTNLMSKGFAEMMRVIREDEPHKPSTRISTLGETGTRTAMQRRVDLKRLGFLLRGDIDWIVMKCLEKDRTRRYETASGLAADIRRHLRDEPVTAGAPSTAYKLRKFVKRNRAQVIAVALVLSASLAGVLGTSWGVVQRNRARSTDLERQLESNQRAAADNARLGRNAEAVAALLRQCEDALRSGDEAQAHLALDAASKRSAEGGAEEQAERLGRLAADRTLLGELDAVDQLRWAWSDNRFADHEVVAERTREALRRFGADPEVVSVEETAARLDASMVRDRIVSAMDRLLREKQAAGVLAVLRRADPDPYRDAVREAVQARDRARLAELARRDEALEQPSGFAAFLGSDEAIPVERRWALLQAAVARRSSDADLPMTLGTLSYSLTSDGLDSSVERMRWFQAAIAADPDNVAALNDLGAALSEREQAEAAAACFRKALALDPTLGNAHNNLGMLLLTTGQVDEAIDCLRKAIECAPLFAAFHANLGRALEAKGRSDEARECFERAIALDPTNSASYSTQGIVLAESGRLDEAIASFRKAVELDPGNAKIHGALGSALRANAQLDEAFASARKAVALDPRDVQSQLNLGAMLCDDQHDYDGAILCFEKAMELDPEHPEARINMGCALAGKGLVDEAIAAFRKGIELDPKHPMARYGLGCAYAMRAAGVRTAPADLEEQVGLRRQALDSLREALALLAEQAEAGKPAGRASVLTVLRHMQDDAELAGIRDAAALAELPPREQDAFTRLWADVAALAERTDARAPAMAQAATAPKPDAGRPFLEDMLERASSKLGPDHRDTLVAMCRLGEAYLTAGDADRALPLYGEAFERASATLGPEDPLTVGAMGQLGVAYWMKQQFADSIPLFEECLPLHTEVFGPDHVNTLRMAANLGVNYAAVGRLAEAIPLLEAAYRPLEQYPSLAWVGTALLDARMRAADPTDPGDVSTIVALVQDQLSAARTALPKDGLELAWRLTQLGETLLELKAWEGAEPMLRESLAILEKVQPDAWTAFDARSRLGEALLGQERLLEAEPLLLEGYRGLKAREASLPPERRARIADALEQLVLLYETTGNATEVATWRSELAAARVR